MKGDSIVNATTHEPGRRRFHEELHELELRVLGGIDVVLEQLDRTLRALADPDIALAAGVIADAGGLDRHYLEDHHRLMSLLARQTPVASDLRLVVALLHVIVQIERMGDQCVNICKLLPLSGNEPPTQPEILALLLRMGALARSEVSQAKTVFERRDVALAQELAREDREISHIQRQIFHRAIDAGADADVREWAMCATLMARALERIGDNAVDVGEQAAFVVTGLFREFSGAAGVDAA
jgi:phosphate transport system protein